VDGFTVGEAAARTGWSPRMLRYVEGARLVVPSRTRSGYRLYGARELSQLRSLRELRRRFGVELGEMAFADRLRSEPQLRRAVDAWFTARADDASASVAWVDWEQRKQERLLAA
jgi:DNA-binding transcriptional MerR regulator